MRALITIQEPDVRPANLGAFFESRGVELIPLRLYEGETMPSDGFDCLVTLGGRMNLGEEDQHPWMAPLTAFIRDWAEAGRPYMGICLGAQLLAGALGAQVYPAQQPEIGWHRVELTPEAQDDPVMAGVAEGFPVIQWHYQTFEIPDEATKLATALKCPNQVFVYKKAYAFQPHLEATSDLLAGWYQTEEQRQSMAPRFNTEGPVSKAQSEKIFLNFLNMAAAS